MGQITANFFISLDGVVERPDQWHFPYFNDEMGAVIGAGMETYDAFLMGRVLYGEWSQYWPSASADQEFGAFINAIPKYVVSDSLESADWTNTTLLRGDTAAARLRELKETTPGGIGMSGSATLVRWLLAENLLDRLDLLIHPIAVGHGARLFEDTPTYPLELLRQTTLSTGVLHATYAPAKP
ncbi:dihydrofolate reductase family protein [Actinomadura atramentaria]|uniref:dihydrofolate reductase family protein n=1 Tax=Actinomadura atramentaria TaxID=1990 RepID=UPI000373FA3D|nr:dihydrofolate reductase family protein [Actinomadura atramentaria]